jgi:hypothetical protein
MSQPRHIRIFLSSPGDVADERAVARTVLTELHREPLLRGRVTIQVIAWDDPSARTPMLATLTPQEAINRRLPVPSECDIVVVMLWSRMGTPLPFPEYHKADGTRYLSGTEWEYLDAVNGAKAHRHDLPLVVVYRRTDKVLLDADDARFEERRDQYQLVKTFFEQFTNPDGSIGGGYNPYEKPDDFRRLFETDIKELIDQLLHLPDVDAPEVPELSGTATDTEAKPPVWSGSPFPGLRAFTEADAPIFFGRGRETDALVRRVSESRFVAVVGASGSGKSSLVGAGLIPRLRGNAIEGSKDWILPTWDVEDNQWRRLRFTPGEAGDNPFMALALRLGPLVGEAAREVADRLAQAPAILEAICAPLFADRPGWAEGLLFIDQFEELFTLAHPRYLDAFVELLCTVATSERLRAVITLRADFYARCVEVPRLADLLETTTYPLAAPTPVELHEMITRPAERAGLAFEDGLPERILADTGSEPGALALMAYALDELYHTGSQDGRLTHAEYDSLGGVQGAIGKRAETVFHAMDAKTRVALSSVFQELVEVDERGEPTRRRSALANVARDEASQRLVEALTDARARLLVQATDILGHPVVEIAHEALLRQWSYLNQWITETQDDLRLLKSLRLAAGEWERSERDANLLWRPGRLEAVQGMVMRLQPQLDAITQDFIRSETDHLIAELSDTRVSEDRRREIGLRLAVIGDPRPGVGLRPDGVPDIVWCLVSHEVTSPFRIARYLTTYQQYKAFLDASDGYNADHWWDGLSRHSLPGTQNSQIGNFPADNVSWYDAVAFCRWLSTKLDTTIRLPSRTEWDIASNNASQVDVSKISNGEELKADWPQAVGLCPFGASDCGPFDMGSLIDEWVAEDVDHVQPGRHPIRRDGFIGFRVVAADNE